MGEQRARNVAGAAGGMCWRQGAEMLLNTLAWRGSGYTQDACPVCCVLACDTHAVEGIREAAALFCVAAGPRSREGGGGGACVPCSGCRLLRGQPEACRGSPWQGADSHVPYLLLRCLGCAAVLQVYCLPAYKTRTPAYSWNPRYCE